MQKRLTRQEHQQQNRLALLAAAERVFAERGIAGASLDEVAAEAGLTKGAVYSNFTGKEDLVLAVMHHRLGREADSQAEHGLSRERPPEELIDAFGRYWAERLGSPEERTFRMVILELVLHSLRRPDVRDQLRDLMATDKSRPHPLVPPDSDLAKLPPGQAENILLALDLGLGIRAMVDPDGCPPELFGVALRVLAGRTPES
jgi:AcrR family transcriptional regulator